jgi:hypothetical protein
VLEVDTGIVNTYLESDRDRFIRDSLRWTEWITFNGLGYDYFVLWKLWGIEFGVGPDTVNGRPVTHIDCLVLSRYLNPDRNPGSSKPHSLETWGEVLGFRKTDWNDFSEYSEEMEGYCVNDTLLTLKVYQVLQRELKSTGETV